MFEIVQESVKVCTTGMSSRTLYAQHRVSIRIFPSLPGYRQRFFFIPMQIQYSYEHTFLCPAVDSKPCVRNCSREREGLYNGNAQQNSLCAASCVTPLLPGSILCHSISPRFLPTFFYRRANPAPCSAQFLIHSSPN